MLAPHALTAARRRTEPWKLATVLAKGTLLEAKRCMVGRTRVV
jgi:hypothetical protein